MNQNYEAPYNIGLNWTNTLPLILMSIRYSLHKQFTLPLSFNMVNHFQDPGAQWARSPMLR